MNLLQRMQDDRSLRLDYVVTETLAEFDTCLGCEFAAIRRLGVPISWRPIPETWFLQLAEGFSPNMRSTHAIVLLPSTNRMRKL